MSFLFFDGFDDPVWWLDAAAAAAARRPGRPRNTRVAFRSTMSSTKANRSLYLYNKVLHIYMDALQILEIIYQNQALLLCQTIIFIK